MVAYARNPSKLNINHEQLKAIQGELADEMLIESAVTGADAVISVLSPRGDSPNKPITQGMQSIITAMNKQNVRRLVITSTLSAKDPNDPLISRPRVWLTSLSSRCTTNAKI